MPESTDFEPYRGELVAYCYRMLGSFHEAEDLVVLTVTGGRVARNVVFADPRVFEAFDLPARISPEEFRPER